MKIQINDVSKINNPIDFIPHNDPAYVSSFEGIYHDDIFKNEHSEYYSYLKHQINNLDKLKILLNNINLQFEYIWLIIFRNNSDRITTSFVIKTNTNQNGLSIFWRKYMSRSEGSGQNDIYITKNEAFIEDGCVDKIKVQLTHFLKEPDNCLESI